MSHYTSPLNNIHVASPCGANWEAMLGDERKRFCGDCKLNVYNLSNMSREEAENLLFESEGRLCVRFFRRADGTVLTKDCPVGWRVRTQRALKVSRAIVASALGFLLGLFSIRGTEALISLIPIQDVPPPLEVYGNNRDLVMEAPIVGEIVDEDGIWIDGQMTINVEPPKKNLKRK